MSISILSVMHVNINCSLLERSLAFYRDVVGLVPENHTNPVPQDGAGFGMSGSVQWDAHILHDARGYAGPAIDLLEWKRPGPCGAVAAAPNHLGFSRVRLSVPDIDAAYQRALSAGVQCVSAPTPVRVSSRDDPPGKAFVCRDPDGVAVEFKECSEVAQTQLVSIAVNCESLPRGREWYERVLGLEARDSVDAGAVTGELYGIAETVEWQSQLLWPEDQDAFAIELCEWKRPKPVGRPPASANLLGFYRMAFMVGDIRIAHEELVKQGVECGPPVFLDMGPEIPVDGVWALFFPDSDGTCMELIETPKLNVPDAIGK